MPYGFVYTRISCRAWTRACYYNNIISCYWPVLSQPVALANAPGHLVSYYAVTYLLTHGYPEAVNSDSIRQNKHDKQPVSYRYPFRIYNPKLAVFLQRLRKLHSTLSFKTRHKQKKITYIARRLIPYGLSSVYGVRPSGHSQSAFSFWSHALCFVVFFLAEMFVSQNTPP